MAEVQRDDEKERCVECLTISSSLDEYGICEECQDHFFDKDELRDAQFTESLEQPFDELEEQEEDED